MIFLKYATRSRPQKFRDNLNRYIGLSSGNLLIVISMDRDDLSMNNDEMRSFLDSKRDERINLKYFYGESAGKINAINRDITLDEDWNVLVATADDMIPMERGWNKIIEEDFGNNFFKAINYNTDPRVVPFTILITLPVIGRVLYEKMGYIYYPDYISEYCDNEQTKVFTSMGVLTHIDKRPIIHKWDENQDSLMARNIKIGALDREIFKKREVAGFK